MKSVTFALLLCLIPATHRADEWPWWRGPDRNGTASADQKPPTEFGPDENVAWVADVPGRGHSSPIVAQGKVFIATADEKTKKQMVLCFDRKTGKELWNTTVHEGGFPKKINKKASHASSAVACDGERIFINFMNGGAVHTTALSLDGKQIWQKEVSPYVIHQGFASSPAIYEDLVIVSADNKNKKGGAIQAMKRTDGEIVWRVERPAKPNYASPIILEADGKKQLFLQGCDLVTSLDPATGKTLWEIEGATTECVTSTVTDGTHFYTSGGYPRNHVAAIKADGSGSIVWENISRVYVPSMVIKDGHLYAVMDAGIAACWDAATGERKWKERVGGETSASAVLVGEHIYTADERGKFSIFKADPEKFELIAQNQIGNQAMGTPAIVDGQIFARVSHNKGGDKLYCFGLKD